jgi:hypothetical protein
MNIGHNLRPIISYLCSAKSQATLPSNTIGMLDHMSVSVNMDVNVNVNMGIRIHYPYTTEAKPCLQKTPQTAQIVMVDSHGISISM